MAKAYKITLSGNATKNYSADVLVIPTAAGKSFGTTGIMCHGYSEILAGYDPAESFVTFITGNATSAINLEDCLPGIPLITMPTDGDRITFSNGNYLLRDGDYLRAYNSSNQRIQITLWMHSTDGAVTGFPGGATAFPSTVYTTDLFRCFYIFMAEVTDGFPTGVALRSDGSTAQKSLVDSFFANAEEGDVPSPSGDDPDPYEEAGGGEGDLPGGEIIGLPTEPTVSPIDAGLFSLYSPTAAQMRNLADFLWTDFGGAGTTVEQVLEEVVEALKRSVSNPLNSMLGLSIIASQGLSKGSDSSVRVGFWNTGVSMTTITKQYFTVDCGSLSFSPVCGNTFLDYAPYSKFMIFLPYVGMRLLDANDVVGHTISIRYRGDCVSGALTCYVIRDGSVIQEHTGNCALNIPLTADSWAQSISAVGQIISGTVAGGAIGGGGAAAAGAVRGAASVATNPSAFSSQVAHTGAVSGAAGHLGSQKPFILREAVRFHSTDGFNSIIGYPSYYYRKLGDCRGYTQCLEVHLNHTPCTGVELQEIEELLKKGVII